MKVYKRDGSTFYFIGFLLLLGIFFTMGFASLDKQTTALESQNNANQIIYRNPISKEDERNGQTSEESDVMLNLVYWGVGIIAILMFVLGYIFIVWRAMDSKKITADEIKHDHHAY